MKVLVLNGSPDGEQSVTLQFVEYLLIHAERRGHSFETLHAGDRRSRNH
jgi:multimeric flavodoxin WrbA